MGRAEAAASARPIRVAVACTPSAGMAVETPVLLAPGASALDAIRASGVLERFAELDLALLPVGIWGRACTLETRLVDGDRVEIYRPLALDPKEARRLRARRRR